MQNLDPKYQICPVRYGNWERAFSDPTTLGEAQEPKLGGQYHFGVIACKKGGFSHLQSWKNAPKKLSAKNGPPQGVGGKKFRIFFGKPSIYM